ncbi:SDR family NAD(P)-dependent oxidoreductase [Burkholderia sp. PAMC 26561]|uniref:SDR family NAD(P)-dependent oxidoreductase n=1 Tax=Burkholderia sp. PAMC 26561 TaxID=1795043 RepID=UPI00076AF0E7|nr:SDR family NAD(P)-dependent oxidoreductase [Burkholderia sp. PAMC 26561]AME27336.1 shikimate dehydrogenase [Burkholderia sp. PAMC 26561]AME27513.1 shikimate dehydrogenase [Burkholderia sp. PAMC 26561]
MSISFGATSTADEVIEGVDLRNRRVLVTGVSSGVGVETARVLASHGACVVGAARDLNKALRATEQVRAQATRGGGFDLIELDLASLTSIRASADKLVRAGERFDVVIANAGVMASPKGTTADGFETQFGTNHLGHFVFVNRIASLIKPGGRLVTVASAGHRGADVDFDDPNFEHTPYDPLVAYRRSKTANILFAVEFDRRHEPAGVRAAAVHPGAVLTETTRKMIEKQPAAASAFQWKTVEQGAATSVWAGFVAAADEVGGLYCEDCHVAAVNNRPADAFGVRTYALDPEHAKALWIKSEEMVGERF